MMQQASINLPCLTFYLHRSSPEARARDFVKFVKNHPLVRKELAAKTVGAVYDIKTGALTVVDA
jgi:carbonic anhydrase